MASCYVSRRHREAYGSLLFIPFQQMFIHMNKIPLSLLFTKLQSQICQPLLTHLCGAALDSLQFAQVSLVQRDIIGPGILYLSVIPMES